MQIIKRGVYLLCIMLVTLSALSCTIGDDDDDSDNDTVSTVIRFEAVVPPELDAAQAANLLLELWVHDLDDSPFDSGARDSDQVDTALLLQSRIGVQEIIQDNIDDRLIFDVDFAGGVSAANNLVFAVLLFPDDESAEPTFVARAGPVDLPDALGTTVAMMLGGAEIVQFDDAAASEADASILFSGTLTPSSPRAVALAFETQDGTALAGEDYATTNSIVRFGSGETETTVVIPILDDNSLEPTEAFNVLLELDISFPINNRAYIAGGLNGGTFTQLIGTITDNDDAPPPPETGIRLEAVLPPELDAQQAANLLLELWVHDLDDSPFDSGARDSDQIDTALLFLGKVRVQLIVRATIEDRLILDVDFAGGVSAANNLVFAVLLFPDESAEPTFVARAGPVDLPEALGTTVAMMLGGAEIVQLDDAAASEADASAIFSGTLTPSSPRAVALAFETQDGTALAGEDYAATNSIVRFGSGETETTVGIPILDNDVSEPTETFNVLLELDISFPINNRAYIAGGLNGGTFTQLIGTITDNDDALPPPPPPSPPPPATSIRFEAVLPPELDAAQAANLLLELWVHDLDDSPFDSGARDSDQVDTALLLQSRIGVQEIVQGTIDDHLIFDVDFAGGVSTANNLVFTVLLFPDDESAEPTFVARAGPANLPEALGTTVAMTLGGAEIVQFDDTAASEADASATFSGTLAPSSPRAIVLVFETQGGTALAGEDYVATNSIVSFGSGETEVTVGIPILDDDVSEPTETFNVLLELDISFPINNRAYIAGGLNGGTFTQLIGTITDNDP